MATSYGVLVKGAQMDLRDNIRELTKRMGWTLAQLARETDIKYGILTQGLSGLRWFTEDEVAALAAVLEVAVDELMGESVFKAEARGSKFDRPHRLHAGADVGTGTGRALCCECGTFRRFGTGDVDYTATNVHDGSDDPLGRRMVTTLKCRTCEKPTLHAELRPEGEHRDTAEVESKAPTREQEATAERNEFIERLTGFNVDIHFRNRGKKSREKGYAARYEYDESKSRWRIEVSPSLPARMQTDCLRWAWKNISTGIHNVDWDPKDGVIFAVTDTGWANAVDELIEDLRRALPIEQQKMRLAVSDEITAAAFSAEEVDQ